MILGKEKVIAKLKKHNIKTLEDIDKIRFDKNSKYYCQSRFTVLKYILNTDTAHCLLHELSFKNLFK